MKLMGRRILALMMALCLLLTGAAFAEEAEEPLEALEASEIGEAPAEEPQTEAEAPTEPALEEKSIPAAEPGEDESPEEAPGEEIPTEEPPEAAAEGAEEPAEAAHAEPEEVPVEPEEAPVEEAEAADEGEELAEEEDFAWPEGLETDGLVVTGYTGSATELVIPGRIKEIGNDAFRNNTTLTKVTLPSSVERIGITAFRGCSNLKSINLPERLKTIDTAAFMECSALESVSIPASVEEIEGQAFRCLLKLSNFEVDSANEHYKAVSGVLYTKDGRLLVQVPALKTSVTILDTVTQIDDHAFERCGSLTSVTIPARVQRVGDYAFDKCGSLKTVVFEGADTEIGKIAFRDCEALTKVTLPGRLEEIPDCAFEYDASLKSITIPATVSTIGTEAFFGCGLTSIALPDGLTSIGGLAFGDCQDLKSVTIPACVTEILQYTFLNDVSLTSITIPATVTSIDDEAFNTCPNLTIYGEEGSYAEAYANAHNIPFRAPAPDVTSASADKTTTPAQQIVTFTVKTPKSAAYLAMFSESGTKVKTWPASGNSTVSGSARTWKVQYAIATAGSRKLTFKASRDGENYGAGKSVSITVTAALLNVTSATAAETTVAAKAPVNFTVKTPKDAKYLAMFSENGTKVKVWGCTNYSQVSGSTRVWTVSYAIANKGDRHLTFKCTKTTTYGEGKTVDLKVVAEQPAVTSASANKSTVAAKETVTFTVKTPSAAKYVALFTESGSKVKVWGMTGNSTVSGDVRTWKIQYAIANKGDRQLTFRASTNGIYGAGKTVSIKVQ